jgi:hypothetical protein
MRYRTPAVLLLSAALALAAAAPASAGTDTDPLAKVTAVGVHNAYEQATFNYLANGLDSGASLLELDVWVDPLLHRWHVSHTNPVGSNNNCVNASTAAGLYTGSRSQDLPACLNDLKVWHDAHPGHRPIVIKVEMKAGFDATAGLGPTEFDQLVSGTLGSAVFRPTDLLARPGGGYATPDAAAAADNWPSRSALSGKFLFELIPGSFEQSNPFDHLWTDVEYAQHLRDLAAANRLGSAQAFPAVLGAAAGDPRTRYADSTLRPWFVFFDGDAATYVGSGIDPSWYDIHHYFLIMTDAQNVPPALDDRNPTQAAAQARVAALAAAHASIVSCDWSGLPAVLSEVLPRG